MRKILLFIMALGIFCSCDNTPEGVLSKSKMEDVLFDYHLVQSMLNNMSLDEKEEKSQVYLDAVFDKYGITQEEFDSSMVWYARNQKQYNEIYKNIVSRYEDMNKELQLQNGNNDMMAVFSAGGDTTNIWGSKNLIVLRGSDILNRESFTIKADTSFHKGDTYILMGKLNMILENKTERKEYVALGLSVTYKNGKTAGTAKTIAYNGNQQLTVVTSDTMDITAITGFFYFNGNPNFKGTAFIDDIKLFRMHKQAVMEEMEEKNDSDSIKAVTTDTAVVNMSDTTHRTHLSPEQIRSLNVNTKKIQIIEAPAVRTPNKYGKRKTTKK